MFLRTVGSHFETRGDQVDELREPQFRKQITKDLSLFSSQAYDSNIVRFPTARSQNFLLAHKEPPLDRESNISW
jgi:hypothetical protein